MRVIVIAAGEGTRWQNHLGLPKHLAPICGEPIIHRTQRQLAERGVTDVRVVAHDPRFVTTATLEAPRTWPDAPLGTNKVLDNFHLWNRDGRTVVVLGDVCFTDAAMDTVVRHEGREWVIFCRFKQSTYAPERWGEVFGQSFWPGSHLQSLEAAERVRRMCVAGQLKRGGLWEHYRAVCNAPDEELKRTYPARDFGRSVVIDDATDDADTPEDYERLLEEFRCTSPSPYR